MRDAQDDPNLAEVKAVLKKIQRIDIARDDLGLPLEAAAERLAPNAGHVAAGSASLGVFQKKHAALVAAPVPLKRKSRNGLILLAAIALVAGGGASVLLLGKNRIVKVIIPARGPAGAPSGSPQSSVKILSEARDLLSQGNIALARSRLLQAGPGSQADLAFTLAQSYDPNYLRTLPNADSAPDRAEAERWYRTWYELALRSGLDMDSERLRRIINAMQ
jgi:hypothetical protein